MFPDNQRFDIACRLEDLADAVAFGIKLSGQLPMLTRPENPLKLAFAVPADGVYAIGCGSMLPVDHGPHAKWSRELPHGWTDYPFDYDPEIVAQILSQWRKKNPPDDGKTLITDGTIEPGLRVRGMQTLFDDMRGLAGIREWDPRATIMAFTPCWLTYPPKQERKHD